MAAAITSAGGAPRVGLEPFDGRDGNRQHGRGDSCTAVLPHRRGNSSAVGNIHLIIADPYGSGWLFDVEPTALEAERGQLIDVAAYRAWLQPRLAEKLVPPIDDFYTEGSIRSES